MTVNDLEQPQQRSRQRRWAYRLAAVGASAALLAACGSSSSSTATTSAGSTSSGSPAAGTYTFGLNAAKTGPVAFAGIDYIRGAELAVDQINASGSLGKGVRIALQIKDGGSVASTDVEVARQFAADSSVIAAFGSILSPDAQAVKPIYNSAKMPYVIYGATDPNLAQPPYIFRTAPLPQLSNQTLAQEIVSTVHPASVEYVVTSDNSGMVSQLSYFKTPFQQAQVKDLGTVDTLSTQSSFLAPAEKIVSDNPAVVVVSCLQTPEVAMIKALREAGYKGHIVANATLGSPAVYTSAAQWVTGIPFGVHFGPQMTGSIQAGFTKAYEAKFNAAPSTYSAQGAIAVQFLAAGLAKAGTHPTRASLAAALGTVSSLSNDIYGPVTFTGGQLNDPRVLSLAWASGGKLTQWSASSWS